MTIEVQVKITGIDDAQNVARRIKTLEPFDKELSKAGRLLVDFYSGQVFDTEGAVYGQTWKQLSVPYRQQKARRYPGRGILERTGKMRNSFRFKSAATMLRVFNLTKYFERHQTGDGVPRRMVMRLDDVRVNWIRDIVADGINQKIKSALT